MVEAGPSGMTNYETYLCCFCGQEVSDIRDYLELDITMVAFSGSQKLGAHIQHFNDVVPSQFRVRLAE